MKPNREGIWEWFDIDDHGKMKLVNVIDCRIKGDSKPYFRVYFEGGYYNVNDEAIGEADEPYCKAEWPDSWGNYYGELNSVDLDKTYWTDCPVDTY